MVVGISSSEYNIAGFRGFVYMYLGHDSQESSGIRYSCGYAAVGHGIVLSLSELRISLARIVHQASISIAIREQAHGDTRIGVRTKDNEWKDAVRGGC